MKKTKQRRRTQGKMTRKAKNRTCFDTLFTVYGGHVFVLIRLIKRCMPKCFIKIFAKAVQTASLKQKGSVSIRLFFALLNDSVSTRVTLL